jgi:hypothetical protein
MEGRDACWSMHRERDGDIGTEWVLGLAIGRYACSSMHHRSDVRRGTGRFWDRRREGMHARACITEATQRGEIALELAQGRDACVVGAMPKEGMHTYG